jgi:alpha/beta superfamily hydrolase
MVSPPVDLFDYSPLYNTNEIRLVISASEDNIADWRSIEKIMHLWNPDTILKVIKGTDHFYWGKTDELKKIIEAFLLHT